MSDYTKPLPNLDDPVTSPFWEATRAHELRFQRCPVCGALRWPPGRVCPECQAIGGEWVAVAAHGTLYSYATYHRALDSRFEDELPYSVGQILTDAGPMIFGRMIGEPESYVIGAPVSAVFDDVTPEITLIRWEMGD